MVKPAKMRKKSQWGKSLASALVGLIFLALGAPVGLASHQVDFMTVYDPATSGAITGGGTDYLGLEGTPYVFIITESDLHPAFAASVLNNALVSLSYRTDETRDTHVSATDGFHLDGVGLTVVQLVAVVNGRTIAYSTTSYQQNLQGYFENDWTFAVPLLVLGMILICLAFFAPARGFVVIQWMLGGAFVLCILGLVFAGVSVPNKLSVGAWAAAVESDLVVFLGLAVIGAAIGLIIGLIQAIRGGGFAGERIEEAFAALGEIQNDSD